MSVSATHAPVADESQDFTLAIVVMCAIAAVVALWSVVRRARQQPSAAASSDATPHNGEASNGHSTGTTDTAKEGHCWWHSPLANDAEAAVIQAATPLLAHLAPLPPHVDLELLRQLRALGKPKPAALAAAYGKHLRWRRENVIWPVGASASVDAARTLWPAAADHGHGAWAVDGRLHIGLNIGRAKGGHVVKIERVGATDILRICDERGGDERLLGHYYSLLDTMLLALNAESAASGQLVRMYEVFDLGGLTPKHARLKVGPHEGAPAPRLPDLAGTHAAPRWPRGWQVIRTMSRLLLTVVSVYAETTVRAALLNLHPAPATLHP